MSGAVLVEVFYDFGASPSWGIRVGEGWASARVWAPPGAALEQLWSALRACYSALARALAEAGVEDVTVKINIEGPWRPDPDGQLAIKLALADRLEAFGKASGPDRKTSADPPNVKIQCVLVGEAQGGPDARAGAKAGPSQGGSDTKAGPGQGGPDAKVGPSLRGPDAKAGPGQEDSDAKAGPGQGGPDGRAGSSQGGSPPKSAPELEGTAPGAPPETPVLSAAGRGSPGGAAGAEAKLRAEVSAAAGRRGLKDRLSHGLVQEAELIGEMVQVVRGCVAAKGSAPDFVNGTSAKAKKAARQYIHSTTGYLAVGEDILEEVRKRLAGQVA